MLGPGGDRAARMRMVLVDGESIARIGDVVKQIEPIEDGSQAWILAYWQTYCPMWRVYRWALEDGTLLEVEAGEGMGVGIAARAGRVFVARGSDRIAWLELGGGGCGEVRIAGRFAGCSRDGRHFTTERRDDQRVIWAQIHPVDGTGEPFAEVPAPLVFGDDGRFAVHIAEDRRSLVRISLDDRTTGSLYIGTPQPAWLGVRAVRGAARMIVWDNGQLVVADLATASVVMKLAVDGIESVDDATVGRVAVSRRSGRSLRRELIELADGRRREVVEGSSSLVLTDDGSRALFQRGAVLDVLDTVTGATRRAYRGHEGIVRALVWARDGRHVATAADDGRIRIVRLDEPRAITELVGTFGALDFSRDGTRLYVVSPSEIVAWEISTATTIARFASFGNFIHSAEVSADGGRLVTGSYGHGIRVFDVATGAPMVIENDATTRSSHVAFAGEQVVACSLERVAGPAVLSPAELVHWTRLDDRGVIVDRGTWRFDVGFGGIALRVGRGVATVAAPGRKLHTYDLRDPNMPPRTVSIPAGARLLDARAGRALLYEGDELVCRDSSTGGELERIRCLRRPTFATLSHDGTGVAVAFSDQGIEVFCA